MSILTNINCSEKCIYQKDGKCSLEAVSPQKVSSNSSCSYFTEALHHNPIFNPNFNSK